MLYRKSSPNPPTLLLRIVATAGAGALLGMTACGDSVNGTVPMPPVSADGGEASTVGGGVVVSPDAGGDAQGPCGGGFCGVVVMPSDAGEAATVGGGVVANPDSGADARGPCNGGVCGVVIHPEGGLD